jgi:hypothetical protein
MAYGGGGEALTSSPRRQGGKTMRKGTMMVALVALLVAIFATAAYADLIEGNRRANILNETSGDDQMYGYRGGDSLYADVFGNDIDELFGGRGDDRLYADDGDNLDLLKGGGGTDRCYGDSGDTFGGSCEYIYKDGVLQT